MTTKRREKNEPLRREIRDIFEPGQRLVILVESHLSNIGLVHTASSGIYEIVRFVPDECSGWKRDVLETIDTGTFKHALFHDVEDFALFSIMNYVLQDLLEKAGIQPIEVIKEPDGTTHIEIEVDRIEFEEVDEEEGTRYTYDVHGDDYR